MALRIHFVKEYGSISGIFNNSINVMENNVLSNNGQILGTDKDDYIVKCTGAFGPWQAKICIIAALVRSTGIWNMLSIVFLTPTTPFSCVKFKNNETFFVNNSMCVENCVKYEFDANVMFGNNLISEFNLVCDSGWKASFTQTVIMFGSLVGVSIFGWISDRFGRRVGLLISTSLNGILMIAAPFPSSYWIFNGIRFFIGVASGGAMVISLVFIIEIVGPEYREAAGSLSIISDGFAQALLSIFAYYAENWKMYLLEYGVVSIFIYMFVLSLPETPKWLMANGKVEKTLNIMAEAVERNKLNLTVSDIQYNILKACDENMMINDKTVKKITYLDLFKTKELAFRALASMTIWFVSGVCYFGINQYITFIGSNLYLSVIILGCIQIPTSPLAMILNKSMGRKVTLVAIFVVTGITMAILVFLPPRHIGCTVLGVVGFAATCTIYGVLCVYVSELFPTPLRTMAFGISTAGTKIGAMVAPFIATITPHWIPSLVFAILPFVASIFCLLLPETKGQVLYDIV